MKLLISILFILNLFLLKAGHIIGGEMYYDYLGGNNYRVFISMYKDCDPAGNWADFDSQLSLAVYSGGAQVQVVSIPFPGSVNIPITYNNPCVTPPPGLCILQAVYTTVLNLPPNANGYVLAYQRCCRKPQITNITNPGDTGFTLTSRIPGSANNNYMNSSARFTNYPPALLCNNDDLVHDQSANDPDNDQLVYSLVTPFQGGSQFNVQPIASAPPYPFVNWVGGFNAAAPLGPGASIAIDANTGLLTASPNLTGLFIIGIRVQEIRNGIVISETVLDFLFQVFACNISLQAILPTQEQLPGFVSYCQGLDVTFANNSYGGTNYAWDFGVPGVNTDVSSAFAPTFTYPAPGIYQAMMIVNPGWPCTDTAYIDINVNNELTVEWTSEDSLCLLNNSFDFVASTSGPAGTTFNWNFGPNGNPATGTGQVVNNVVFSASGYIPVTVEANFNVCTSYFTDSIYIFAEPIAGVTLPVDIECEGLTIQFTNNSQSSVYYNWNFGVPGTSADTSNLENPIYTFPAAGNYDVTLITGINTVCSDTVTVNIELNEKLVIAWTSEDSLCITNNSFNFDGTVSGPPNSVYTWNFGPNASIPTSTNIDEPAVSFFTPGSIPISLTGTFENCIESVTQNIYLYSEPTIDFMIAPGLQCAPFYAHFLDLSTAETGISYLWDFGNGSTSTEQNPYTVYPDVGPFVVTLSISTAAGCISSLTLSKPDLVNVRPKPDAGFSVDPDYTDICHSLVNFTDESSGALAYFYWFDDNTAFSNSSNPSYLYLNDGRHYPAQIVTNEYGCKDTAYSSLYIEPFTLYVPNTFTPDGDMYNNTFLPIAYLGVETWLMQIFNRWGQLIFETEDIFTPWDGTTPTGTIAQSGTYVWKVTYTSCEPMNPEQIETGHINVLR